jgi:hypothetical protein
MPLGNAEADLILQSALRLFITSSRWVSSSPEVSEDPLLFGAVLPYPPQAAIIQT